MKALVERARRDEETKRRRDEETRDALGEWNP